MEWKADTVNKKGIRKLCEEGRFDVRNQKIVQKRIKLKS